MKSRVLCIVCIGLLSFFSCKKHSSGPSITVPPFNGTVTAFSPVAVTKNSTKKVFAHYMPWFETPAYTPYGTWGQHWTMSNQTPPTHIASWYYPSIGPYASGDTAVIDYQLLLMKLSGIDGVFIDWPGTINVNDFAWNVANTAVLVSRIGAVGLKYAIVYEDQNLSNVAAANQISQAQTDMSYLQNNFFEDPNYEKFSGEPVLLDFGPQILKTGADWTSVFSVLPATPSFFTLLYQTNEAAGSAVGEFGWVDQNGVSDITNFYNSTYSGTKISAAFSGFNSFYAQGGWPGPTWVITPTVATFKQTVDLALAQNNEYIQLVTWNDYGEGTMIEPTTTFGYQFLTTLQTELSVSSLSQSDLEAVAQLYQLRQENALNPAALNKLNQVYYYMASLQMNNAKGLLSTF